MCTKQNKADRDQSVQSTKWSYPPNGKENNSLAQLHDALEYLAKFDGASNVSEQYSDYPGSVPMDHSQWSQEVKYLQ